MTEPNEKVSLDSDGISICSRSLCDNGLYARMADLMNKAGMSQRQAAEHVAEELDGKFTAKQVLNKFQYLERKINPPKKVTEIQSPDKPSAPKETSPTSSVSVSSTCVTNNEDEEMTAMADTTENNSPDNDQDGLPIMDQESQESKPHQNPFIDTSSNTSSEDTQDAPVSNSSTNPGQTTSQPVSTSEASSMQSSDTTDNGFDFDTLEGHDPNKSDPSATPDAEGASEPNKPTPTSMDKLQAKLKGIIRFLDKLEGVDKAECERQFATFSMTHVNKVMSIESPLIKSAARCMLKGVDDAEAICPEN